MSVSLGQRVSLVFGVFYLLVGVLGFVPGITAPQEPIGQGLLLNVFAVNLVHNLAHLVVGAVALYAGLLRGNFLALSKLLALVFAALFVLSFVAPAAEGLKINLPDTGLHLVSALITGYLGFATDEDGREEQGCAE